MRTMRWDLGEARGFFSVAPEADESGSILRYTVARAGLALQCTAYPHESVVELRLRRVDGAGDLVAFALLVSGEVERRSDRRGEVLRLAQCRVVADRFQFVRGERQPASGAPVLDAEIQIDPDLRVAFSWRV